MDNISEIVRLGQDAFIKANVRKPQPRYVNRISDIGHSCNRYLYHARVDWGSRKEISNYLYGIFETGNVLEEFIRRNFNDYGRFSETKFRIVGDQAPTRDAFLSKYKIQGTSDGTLQIQTPDGLWVSLGAIDIKTMDPNIYRSVDTLEDLDRYEWTRKYKSQVMLYSLADNLDMGYLLLANKSNIHDVKLIEVPLDYAHAESLLLKAQAVNEAVDKAEPPAKINRPDICLRCDFEPICCPAIQIGEGMDILGDDELIEIIDRRNEIADYKKEYDALDKRLKERLVKGRQVLCGKYLVQWSSFVKKAYTVAESEQFRMKITSTEADTETD